MKTGKDRLSRWDRIMMAITFAEAGEAETAREMLQNRTGKQKRQEPKTIRESAKKPRLRV